MLVHDAHSLSLSHLYLTATCLLDLRIQGVPRKVYESLLTYLEAPEENWVHEEHSHEWGKAPSNPLSAHVVERAWNVMFDCLDVDVDECTACDETLSINGTCPPSSCQCTDSPPSSPPFLNWLRPKGSLGEP